MSVNKEIRSKLPPTSIVFDNQSYDNSIIGVTFDGAAIYSFERMIEEYMEDNKCTEDEAMDWFFYNTVRALPYFPEPKPIIVSEGIM